MTLDFYANDDALAPWNPDTSATFGTHIELGPGLLIRSGFIRVDGGSVVEWNPRFTNKVEFWGDAVLQPGQGPSAPRHGPGHDVVAGRRAAPGPHRRELVRALRASRRRLGLAVRLGRVRRSSPPRPDAGPAAP